MDQRRFIDNLTRQAEENPVFALAVAGGLITAVSKLVNAAAWRREVARRAMKDMKK